MNILDIKKEYKKVFYLDDDGILDILIATVISTYLKSDPIWLLIVGPSSGGKSELINLFRQVTFVHSLDELTESTFLSGSRTAEASFLDVIGAVGCIAIKDFTNVLQMREDKREIILSQMRVIYDGEFNKKTGNGKNPTWVGKISFIGGVTDAVYTTGESSADMGRRTINYVMHPQDRQITAIYAKRNKESGNIHAKRDYLQQVMKDFVAEKVEQLPHIMPKLEQELTQDLTNLADFVTQARTPVKRNFRGEMVLVNDYEMPMRVDNQIQVLSQTISWLYDGVLSDSIKNNLYKTCLDCIPKQRRIVLNKLTEFKSVTTRALATHLGYPTETVRTWLEDLNAVDVVARGSKFTGVDKWTLKDKFKKLMIDFGGIASTDEDLFEKESDGINYSEEIDPGYLIELQRNARENADRIFDSLNFGDEI